jgi:hypothetical protein
MEMDDHSPSREISSIRDLGDVRDQQRVPLLYVNQGKEAGNYGRQTPRIAGGSEVCLREGIYQYPDCTPLLTGKSHA